MSIVETRSFSSEGSFARVKQPDNVEEYVIETLQAIQNQAIGSEWRSAEIADMAGQEHDPLSVIAIDALTGLSRHGSMHSVSGRLI